MSTAAAVAQNPQSRPRHRIQGRQSFLLLARSEWIKIRSLPSTWVAAALTVLVTVLIGAGLAIGHSKTPDLAHMAKDMVTIGSALGQLVVVVLSALVITSEYSSGQIRSSLSAAPRRTQLMAAKVLVVSLLAFILGAGSMLLTWAVSAPFMGEHAGSLTDSHYLAHIWGSGLSFIIIAVLGLALGYLLRSTAGAISVSMVLLFVLSVPLSIAEMKWDAAKWINNLLPLNAAQALVDPYGAIHAWGAEGSFTLSQPLMAAIAVAWAVVPLLAAWAVFIKRDA